jgi:hypothetical protein
MGGAGWIPLQSPTRAIRAGEQSARCIQRPQQRGEPLGLHHSGEMLQLERRPIST